MGISEIKDRLFESLNPSIFSLNSIPGIIVLILIITIIYCIAKKATQALNWILKFILLYECFFCLSLTGFNDLVPLSKVFRFDICTSLAQLFVGTPICDGFLYVASFIAALMNRIWEICRDICYGMWWIVELGWDLIKDGWHSFWNHPV